MKEKRIKIMTALIFMGLCLLVTTCSYAANDIIVALDPGHGGSEPGAQGGTLVEKDLTWKIAVRVKEILDATPGIKGILTKEDWETLDRYPSAHRAIVNNADLLVSFLIN